MQGFSASTRNQQECNNVLINKHLTKKAALPISSNGFQSMKNALHCKAKLFFQTFFMAECIMNVLYKIERGGIGY